MRIGGGGGGDGRGRGRVCEWVGSVVGGMKREILWGKSLD